MYPQGYGNRLPPPDSYRPHQNQHSMIQEHPDQYQQPHHHVQHPSFPDRSSMHYPSAPAPPYSPFDSNPPPPRPEYLQFPLPPPPPTHQYRYPPPPDPHPPQYGLPLGPPLEAHRPTFGAYILSSSEYAYARPTFGEHSHPSSEPTYARPAFDHTHSPSFPHHTSSFQENKPRISERAFAAPLEPDPPTDVELPKGQLVRVFCKSSRSYNLAVKDGRLTMVEADSGNESQQWIRDDKYSIRVRDSYGHPAFMLINKASKKVLKHAGGKLQEVQLTYYSPDIQDDDLFWTESQDFGEGFKTLRMASNTVLNLSAGYGNKIEDGSPIILDTWHKKDTQLWKIFPL